MSTRLDDRKRVKLPEPRIPADYPHDSCDWPDDMVHAARPSQMKRALERRGHQVTTNANDTYMSAKHGVLPVGVDFFKPSHDEPWRITDRARILRALKLFGFFCHYVLPAAAVGAVVYFGARALGVL